MAASIRATSVMTLVKIFKQTQNCLLPIGVTSENVSHCFTVSRQEQYQAAVDSHRKAVVDTAAGRFKDEIMPVATKVLESREAEDGIDENDSVVMMRTAEEALEAQKNCKNLHLRYLENLLLKPIDSGEEADF